MKVLNHLVNTIRSTADYNPEAEVRPHCILWTDRERQWESVIPRLKQEMHELLILGEYEPNESRGPAIWIRVAMNGLIGEFNIPFGRIPIIYMPGVSRQDLRAVDQCPEEFKPLAELQYRGVIWSQINARDWTIFAYLKTKKSGLGINVPQDEATLNAMKRAFLRLLDENIEDLKGIHLDKDYFNSLIIGGDSVKDILMWMSDSDNFKAGRSIEEWQAFVDICNSKYKFHPEQDGLFVAAERLVWKDELWNIVWNRFCEAPTKYQATVDVLRNTVIPITVSPERSPDWNDQQEAILRKEFKALDGMTEQNARHIIMKLEVEHHTRRESVWAEIGEAPLVKSLKWLSKIADLTNNKITGSFPDMAFAYEDWGWLIDDAAIQGLLAVRKQEDIESVIAVIRSIYLPWMDESARILQKHIRETKEYPANNKLNNFKENECVFFVDGLRFDLAKRLIHRLNNKGLLVKETTCWTSIPSVTATCKPALTPVADLFIGREIENSDFTPVLKESGQNVSKQKVNNLMTQAGWSVLQHDNLHRVDGIYGWYEFGHIDEDGHSLGWRMVQNVERYLNEVQEKVETLLKSGWQSVKLVSDHGWLFMPQGLPKSTLPASFVESKWGRCAAIKPGALFDGSFYTWYWNNSVEFALAEGVSCYRASMEYTHGGISLQECLMLQLQITANDIPSISKKVEITDITWKGMRCKLAAEGNLLGIRLDIRIKPAMSETTIVMSIKEFTTAGIVSVVVDDDANEGATVYLVLLDEYDNIIYQTTTIVGGGK